MKTLRLCAAAAITGLLAMPILAQEPAIDFDVRVREVALEADAGPPPPLAEYAPAARPGYIWAPGYWRWTGLSFVWIPGAWIAERPGAVWVAEQWTSIIDGRWHFEPGHWVVIGLYNGWRPVPIDRRRDHDHDRGHRDRDHDRDDHRNAPPTTAAPYTTTPWSGTVRGPGRAVTPDADRR